MLDFTNFAFSTLGSEIVTGTTTFTIADSDASKFPTGTFRLTVWSKNRTRPKDDTGVEIIDCTRSGNTLTITTRALEGTAESDHETGDYCAVFLTAGIVEEWVTAVAESLIPSLSGNSGKYLTNNGTILSWSDAVATLTGTQTLTNKTITSPKINEDVVLTSTATELNILDGATLSTAELNILDGLTATAAELNALDGINDAWTSFTPSWTNLTPGTGATNSGRYKQIGKILFFVVSVTLGTSPTVGSNPVLSLPVAKSSSFNANTPIGISRYYDVSPGAIYLGQITAAGNLTVYGSAGTYVNEAFPSSTIPFTWAAGDALWLSGFYEVA